MNCPVCDDVRMREVEKDGVLIDLCPQCKGVWLDRGELDKLMQGVREVRQEFNQWYDRRYEEKPRNDLPPSDYGHASHGSYSHGHGHGHYRPKKKKHVMDILGDLFE